MLCTETWATANDSDEHYHIAGHDMHRFDNTHVMFEDRPHRGMILYTKLCLISNLINSQNAGFDILGMQCITDLIAVNIIGIYRAPQMPMATFLHALDSTLSQLPSANPFIIMGDFNVDIGNINPETAQRLAYEDAGHHLRALVQFMMHKGLAQQVEGARADSGLQIDHIWTDVHHRLGHMHPTSFGLECLFSDHRPIGMYMGEP